MAQQVIIISPDEALVATLCTGLADAEITEEPAVLIEYPSLPELREQIESSHGRVAAVLVDLSGRSRALELIGELRDAHPDIPALAADSSPSRTSFSAATEAGAWGYLMPPFDLGPLAKHFRQVEEDVSEPEESRLVSFMPVQGGNGASTIALHVADAISHQVKERALLVDFDFHSGTVAFRLRLKPKYTLADVMEWENFSDDNWEQVVCRWNQLDVLVAPPSNRSISGGSFIRIPEILASAMRVYRYVIVDLPDPIFSSSRDILNLSDTVYLVCTPELMSLHLARRKAQQIRSLGVPAENLRLVVNRVGSWGSLQTDHVGEVVGIPVTWTLDNDYAALREATWSGGLVPQQAALAQQLQDLGSQIIHEADAPRPADSVAS